MSHDECAALIDTKNYAVSVLQKEHLPIDLNFCENPVTMNEFFQNIESFKEWCASRTLMMSQKHAKKICNFLGISQENSTENRARIALSYHCSTLMDFYWVQREDEILTWEDVSLFSNPSRNVLTPVSLRGEVSSLFSKRLKNWSDIGVDGTLAKSWIKKDGQLFLYREHENISGEITASRIGQQIGANAVSYQCAEVKIDFCPCFTNENIGFLPYKSLVKAYGNVALELIKARFLSDFANLTVFTYLTGNEDLHGGNWGVLFTQEDGIISLAPLFDFDGCFLPDYEQSKDLLFLPECRFVSESGRAVADYNWDDNEIFTPSGPTLEEAALLYAQDCTLDLEQLTDEFVSALLPGGQKSELLRRTGLVLERMRQEERDEI
jgi:hypothetical protein